MIFSDKFFTTQSLRTLFTCSVPTAGSFLPDLAFSAITWNDGSFWANLEVFHSTVFEFFTISISEVITLVDIFDIDFSLQASGIFGNFKAVSLIISVGDDTVTVAGNVAT